MPLRPRPRPVPRSTPLGEALCEVRRSLRLSQSALGARIGVCRDVVSRWEHGLAGPLPANRAALLELARATPEAATLRLALGDAPPEAPSSEAPEVPAERGVAAAPARVVADAKAHLDAALHRAAEGLDVKSRALRVAVSAVLAAVEETGLTVGEARAVIASPPCPP